MNSVARGRLAEQVVAEHLAGHGWVILDRNVRTAAGELDLVARDGDVVVVVEVKARQNGAFGSGLEAIDARKERRLRRAAVLWAADRGRRAGLIRFDAVLVHLSREGVAASLFHLRDVIGDGR